MSRAAISSQTSAVECNGEQTVTPSANLNLSPDTRLSHAPQSAVSPHILAIDDDPSIREAGGDNVGENNLRDSVAEPIPNPPFGLKHKDVRRQDHKSTRLNSS